MQNEFGTADKPGYSNDGVACMYKGKMQEVAKLFEKKLMWTVHRVGEAEVNIINCYISPRLCTAEIQIILN